MSRVGRMPVAIPAGVTVSMDGNTVTVKGPVGTLTETFDARMNIAVENNEIVVTRPTDDKQDRSLHGLTRALINNMVIGASVGFKKVLMIYGVGYKAVKVGNAVQLYLGYSLMKGTGLPQDKYIVSETDDVKISVPNEDEIKKQGIDQMTTEKINGGLIIVVTGADKQKVGQMAAVIRGKRTPEPYHGKGIRYIDEVVRRKAGKTGK